MGVWGQNLSRTSVVGVCVLGVGQEEESPALLSPWRSPHGSRPWRPNLETNGEEAAGRPCLCSLASAFGGRWTQSRSPHGKPCWVPTPGMASGGAEGHWPAGSRQVHAEVVWPWALGILPLHSTVLGYLYLRAVRTPAVGRHSTGLAGCRRQHPSRLFEAGPS